MKNQKEKKTKKIVDNFSVLKIYLKFFPEKKIIVTQNSAASPYHCHLHCHVKLRNLN